MTYTSPAWWITRYAFLTATWEKKMDGTSERRTSKQDKKNNNNGTISSVNISKAIAEWKMTGNVNSSNLQDVRSPSVIPSEVIYHILLLANCCTICRFDTEPGRQKGFLNNFRAGEKNQKLVAAFEDENKQPRCAKLTILWDLRPSRMCLLHTISYINTAKNTHIGTHKPLPLIKKNP